MDKFIPGLPPQAPALPPQPPAQGDLPDVPCPLGSGCVESAIRRVINRHLKALGTFWTRDRADCFLFLRAQLLSGRWNIVLDNITRQTTTRLERLDDSPVPAPSYPMLQAA